jgi:hypothetical protein
MSKTADKRAISAERIIDKIFSDLSFSDTELRDILRDSYIGNIPNMDGYLVRNNIDLRRYYYGIKPILLTTIGTRRKHKPR